MEPPAFALAIYVVWLGLLLGWDGPPSRRVAKFLFVLNLLITVPLWLFMVMSSDAFYASPFVDALWLTQHAATISLPITLSYWLFGPPAKLSFRNAAARVALATLAGVWMAYLVITYAIGSRLSLSAYWLEYVFLGILAPVLAVVAGYFGLRRADADAAAP